MSSCHCHQPSRTTQATPSGDGEALTAHELSVVPALLEELGVRALLQDGALPDHGNLVGILDRAEPMRNDEDCGAGSRSDE